MHEMKQVELKNNGASHDKTFAVGSKLIRSRVCKSQRPLLSEQNAQHNVAYLIRTWLVDTDGETIMQNDCRCGFTERVDTVHQSQVSKGILALIQSNEGMTEKDARDQWWQTRQDEQRQKAAEECYAKTTLMLDAMAGLETDPDEPRPE